MGNCKLKIERCKFQIGRLSASCGWRENRSLNLQFAIAFLLASLLFFVLAAPAVAQTKTSCIECHIKLDDPRLSAPAKAFDSDIHKSRGLSCNDCHGGDPNADTKEAAKDPRKGYLGKPKTLDIPAYCGKCHSDANLMKRFNPSLRVDQEREYYTSIHGKLLKEKGETRVATCISCHSVHGIRAPSDPLSSVYPANVAETCSKCHASADYMKPFGIPSDQYAKYRTSVHANSIYVKQDLSAPTCNDCHGNHGAAPPSVASVANVCGTCHVRQADLFQKSPHAKPFPKEIRERCDVAGAKGKPMIRLRARDGRRALDDVKAIRRLSGPSPRCKILRMTETCGAV